MPGIVVLVKTLSGLAGGLEHPLLYTQIVRPQWEDECDPYATAPSDPEFEALLALSQLLRQVLVHRADLRMEKDRDISSWIPLWA